MLGFRVGLAGQAVRDGECPGDGEQHDEREAEDQWCGPCRGDAETCRGDGTAKKVGDWVHNPEYAATLRLIAEGGSDVFYKGELADRIVSDMREHGGLVTARDVLMAALLGAVPGTAHAAPCPEYVTGPSWPGMGDDQ